MTEHIAGSNTWHGVPRPELPEPSPAEVAALVGITTDKTAPKQVPSGNHYGHGHAHMTGTDRTMWGQPSVTLYGTAEHPQLFAAWPMRGTVAFNADPAELVRFAREVLAFYGQDSSPQLPPWRPASNGASARPWFLCRYSGQDDTSVPLADRYYFGAVGTLIRYASEWGAQRAADKLNAAEATA